MYSLAIRLLRAFNHLIMRLLNVVDNAKATSINKSFGETQTQLIGSQAAIVMTTFSDRFFSHAIPTLRRFKESNLDRSVFLIINGDQGTNFNEATRTRFLSEALSIYPVSPICFGSGRGMAEMWNAGARYADRDKLIFLNEDLMIDPSGLSNAIKVMEDALETRDLVLLNQSFGHFGVKRDCLMELGWFDERFLGFGEEDGDFMWRFETSPKYGASRMLSLTHSAIKNMSSKVGYSKIVGNSSSKYSAFNVEILRLKYRFTGGQPQGLFQESAEVTSAGPDLYPQEPFRKSASHLLSENRRETLSSELRGLFF